MIGDAASIGMAILPIVIALALIIPLGALMLVLSGKIFKKQIDFSKALIPAAIIAVIDFSLEFVQILIGFHWVITLIMGVLSFFVGLVLYLILPKFIFSFSWNDGLMIGAVWFGFMFIIGFIIAFIIGIVMIATGFAIGAQSAGII